MTRVQHTHYCGGRVESVDDDHQACDTCGFDTRFPYNWNNDYGHEPYVPNVK